MGFHKLEGRRIDRYISRRTSGMRRRDLRNKKAERETVRGRQDTYRETYMCMSRQINGHDKTEAERRQRGRKIERNRKR